MARSKKLQKQIEPGSIEEIASALLVWAEHATQGLARVEFVSELARQRVDQQIAQVLAEKEIPFQSIQLPVKKSATEVVEYLKEQLESVGDGVVSVHGFETAFDEPFPFPQALGTINFKREVLARLPLRQIWWMTPLLAEEFITRIPDINSWFILRLRLTETPFLEPKDSRSILEEKTRDRTSSTDPDSEERAQYLLERVNNVIRHVQESSSMETFQSAAATLNNLGIALDGLHRLDAAVEAFEKALALYRDLATQLTDHYRPDVAMTLYNLGNALRDLGRLEAAVAAYEEALALYRALFKKQPNHYRPNLAGTLHNLGIALRGLGRLDAAVAVYEEALALYRALASQQPEVYCRDVAMTLNNLGAALGNLRRQDEAVAAYEEALCLFLRAPSFGLEHPWTQATRDNLMRAYRESGKGLVEANRLADGILRKAMEADEPCG